jgi:serine protease Do
MYSDNNQFHFSKKHTARNIILLILFTIFISLVTISGFLFLLYNEIISLPGIDTNQDFSEIIQQPNTTNDDSGLLNDQTLSLQQTAKKVIPSVVGVLTYSDYNTSTLYGEGSGVILTQDGYILTNAHVIKGGNSFKIVLYDGKEYKASLVGNDTPTDIALLKANASDLSAAEFSSGNQTTVGDIVLAIGNPGGVAFSSSTTMGIISATNRSITTEDGYVLSCIQTDAAISPGNSGGALANTYGQVIGISSSKIVASGFEGLGFAITSDVALAIAQDLKEYGYVKDRAALGVSYQFINEATAAFYNLPTGMFIQDITNNSLTKAGLKKGDIITHIDGVEIKQLTDITSTLLKKKPQDTVEIKIYRSDDDSTFTATVTLIEATHN